MSGIEDSAGTDEVNQPHMLKIHVMLCGDLNQGKNDARFPEVLV